ncbi:MAG: flavodoxin domain-containing protein [Prevotella sp.]|jgi:menaquinone-dependent protoporphyrinogen oxidase|nr:flavodoxin domain-containing protein [Prevotella sp.]
MKIAIIYCSKYGTTEKVCHAISKMVGKANEVDLFDLKNQKKLNVHEYDAIVLGSSVYAGKPRTQMVEFCKNNEEQLLSKRLFLFVCGMDKEHAAREIEMTYPAKMLQAAEKSEFIEGEFLLNKISFIERLMLRVFFKVKQSVTREYDDIVRDFAGKLMP